MTRLNDTCLRLLRGAVCAVALIGLASPVYGEDGDIPELVRTGVRHYANQKYEAAEESFRMASEADPDNETVRFDRACALSAAGQVDEARELFRDAALSRNTAIAADSHYNLGCLHADEGRAILGEDPLAATGETRENAVSALTSAARQFRDCLDIVPEHQQARHNLELVRLYLKHIQSEWDRIDRERERQQNNLLQFLELLEQRQQQLRGDVLQQSAADGAAQTSRMLPELQKRQRALQEEIQPLKQKISEELSHSAAGSSAAPAPAPQPDPQTQQMLEVLTTLADDAGKRMDDSVSHLTRGDASAAAASQQQVLDQFHQIILAVAPFQHVLQRAIKEQERNLDRTEPFLPSEPTSPEDADSEDADSEDADSEELAAVGESEDSAAPAVSAADDTSAGSATDAADLPWYQQRITDSSRMLALKAEAMLPGVEQQLTQLAETSDAAEPGDASARNEPADEADDSADQPSHDESDSATSTDAPMGTSGEQQLDAVEQMKALQRALTKAVERGPQAVEHSERAGDALSAQDYLAAAAEETETLRILQEIAHELPPPPDQEQDQPGDQDQQNDQQQQDQQSDDENQSSDEQDGQSQQDAENDSQQEQPDEQQSDEEPAAQSTQERAESVLRRAQERERQHREMQKRLRALLEQRIRVERDW